MADDVFAGEDDAWVDECLSQLPVEPPKQQPQPPPLSLAEIMNGRVEVARDCIPDVAVFPSSLMRDSGPPVQENDQTDCALLQRQGQGGGFHRQDLEVKWGEMSKQNQFLHEQLGRKDAEVKTIRTKLLLFEKQMQTKSGELEQSKCQIVQLHQKLENETGRLRRQLDDVLKFQEQERIASVHQSQIFRGDTSVIGCTQVAGGSSQVQATPSPTQPPTAKRRRHDLNSSSTQLFPTPKSFYTRPKEPLGLANRNSDSTQRRPLPPESQPPPIADPLVCRPAIQTADSAVQADVNARAALTADDQNLTFADRYSSLLASLADKYVTHMQFDDNEQLIARPNAFDENLLARQSATLGELLESGQLTARSEAEIQRDRWEEEEQIEEYYAQLETVET